MSAAGEILSRQATRPRTRRLSSVTATREELLTGPAVVVPPKHLMSPSNAHETAETMELAKHRLNRESTEDSPPGTPPITSVTDSYAFAFDIDGVLIRGGKPIPEAIEAMKVLNGQNAFGVKVCVFGIEQRLPRPLISVVLTSS